MPTQTAYGNSRLSFWLRVRESAVPPSMIETATARRSAGDWAGACAAAGVGVDLDPRSVARTHGSALAARLRSGLRHLAPDLLRGLVDGALAPLDHDPAEIRREELLMAFGGPPLPGLRVVDEAHRRPDCLTGVSERLDHGDITGALTVVEALLGPPRSCATAPWPDTRPPCRTVVGLFSRPGTRRWSEYDPEYRPDAPPEWARVVTIG